MSHVYTVVSARSSESTPEHALQLRYPFLVVDAEHRAHGSASADINGRAICKSGIVPTL
jgi:hypothetical protein